MGCRDRGARSNVDAARRGSLPTSTRSSEPWQTVQDHDVSTLVVRILFVVVRGPRVHDAGRGCLARGRWLELDGRSRRRTCFARRRGLGRRGDRRGWWCRARGHGARLRLRRRGDGRARGWRGGGRATGRDRHRGARVECEHRRTRETLGCARALRARRHGDVDAAERTARLVESHMSCARTAASEAGHETRMHEVGPTCEHPEPGPSRRAIRWTERRPSRCERRGRPSRPRCTSDLRSSRRDREGEASEMAGGEPSPARRSGASSQRVTFIARGPDEARFRGRDRRDRLPVEPSSPSGPPQHHLRTLTLAHARGSRLSRDGGRRQTGCARAEPRLLAEAAQPLRLRRCRRRRANETSHGPPQKRRARGSTERPRARRRSRAMR